MHHKFEQSLNAAEAIKNFYCVKSEGEVDHITREVIVSCLWCKNFDDQATSVTPTIVDSETELQTIEAKLREYQVRSASLSYVHDLVKSVRS